jgi:hypothetical protein
MLLSFVFSYSLIWNFSAKYKPKLVIGRRPAYVDDGPFPVSFTHSNYARLAQLCHLRAVDLMVI